MGNIDYHIHVIYENIEEVHIFENQYDAQMFCFDLRCNGVFNFWVDRIIS